MTKFKDYIRKQKSYFIIAGVILFLSIVVGIIFGIFPFGDKSLATYDGWHQICPTYDLIFDFLEGKSSLFYSTSLGGGMNTFGTIAYTILSPFSLIFLLGGRAGAYNMFTIVIVMKLLLIALLACWFIRKYYKNVNEKWQILLSLLYATGGYFTFCNTWITWLDFLIYLPLLFASFKHLIDNEKVLPFAIVLAFMICTCFGIGSFSMITLFILFGAYVLICLDKAKQKRVLMLTTVGFAVAGLFSLVVLVPSFCQYLNSGRVTQGFFYYVFKGGLFAFTETKFAGVVADGIMLLLAIVFIIRCDKQKAVNKFLIFAFVITILPNFVDGVNLLLNLGSYNCYPYRLEFIYSFVVLIMATSYINDKSAGFYPDADAEPQTKASKKSANKIMALVSVVAVIGITFVLVSDGKAISAGFSQAQSNWPATGSYFVLVLCLTLVFATVAIFAHQGKFSKKVFTTFAIICCAMQIVVNLGFGLLGATPSTDMVMSAKTFISEQNLGNKRVKDIYNTFSANGQLDFETKTVSVFSSSTPNDVCEMMNTFDYYSMCSGGYSYGGSMLSDALLGYKYFLAKEELNRPYLTLVAKQETKVKTIYLYENSLALSEGFLVKRDFELPHCSSHIENQNALYTALGGTGELVQNLGFLNDNVEIITKNLTIEETDTEYKFKVKEIKELAYMTIQYTATQDGVLYAIADTSNFIVAHSGQTYKALGDSTIRNNFMDGMNDLAYVHSGEQVSMNLYIGRDTILKKNKNGGFTFAFIPQDKVTSLIQSMRANMQDKVELEYKKDGFNLKANSTEEYSRLIFTAPYSKNYVCTNNGSTSTISSQSSVIVIDLDTGENNITLRYKNPLVKLILVSGFVGLSLGIGLLLLVKLLKEKLMCMSGVIRVMYLSLGTLLLAFFYVFPILVFIARLVIGKI